MRLLILGGTVFLGRHLVAAAKSRGHELTLFNRGRSNPQLFPDVEQLHGDRDGGLQILEQRTWDAVVDTSGYFPRVVGASANVLATRADHYTFVSSISVYADFATAGMDESYPVGVLKDPSIEQITGESYGPLKALCERAVEATFSRRALIVRPGLIVGPHDPSDRFAYWPHRLERGGDVLAPAPENAPVQLVDARDLAEWIVRLVEAGTTGTYNATGPSGRLTMGAMLEACRTVSESDARLVWASEEFLLAQGVTPWTELPLWVPNSDGTYDGFSTAAIGKAIAAGLAFRPLEQTIRDTLDLLAVRPANQAWRAGLRSDREAELLAAWEAECRHAGSSYARDS